MQPLLLKIPFVEPPIEETEVHIRVLSIDGKTKVLEDLTKWATSEKADFRKIIHAMRIAAQTKRGGIIQERHVKACSNPKYGGVYEFRADKRHARVMFFYDSPELIICTNAFWKSTSKKQDAAFKECWDIKSLWGTIKTNFQKDERHLTF